MALPLSPKLPPHYDAARVAAFIARWQASSANERANKDLFFVELCEVLGVAKPNPKGADDGFVFEKDLAITHPNGAVTTCFIDLYKRDHFVLEAKQGGDGPGAKGTAKRHTAGWAKAMEAAFGQAKRYAVYLPEGRPPFLLTCDIGHCFEVWTGFGRDYGGYGARRTVSLAELQQPETFALFRDIFENPAARDPALAAARVTREVAGRLAELAASLERAHEPGLVARFLMRCLFTMFAEDVGLLPDRLFTRAFTERWHSHPEVFASEVEQLWRSMDQGLAFGYQKLLRFNGGLFAEAAALPLDEAQLEILEAAARCDWSEVEPAIFGTLLERALSPRERHRLGAHYTPRAYIERLVRVVVEEPLRAEWETVEAEVRQLLDEAEAEPLNPKLKDPGKARAAKVEEKRKKAVALIEIFLIHLAGVRVLDPACGSGNFLYVTMDLLKRLEAEALQRLDDVRGGTGEMMLTDLGHATVTPAQFLGLEIKPWAHEIAELVIWIGHLQWHRRIFGMVKPPEPILKHLHTIEHRDAVMTFAGREPDVDPATGLVRTRWDGLTYTTHPATGLPVPDEQAREPGWRYLDPRPAAWPACDFIVGNPPFIGAATMRRLLGDGYVEALRATYPEVPDSADLVMFWWHKAAELVRTGQVRRFGFITTNSLSQAFNRRVLEHHLGAAKPLKLLWAIPDHPWVEGDLGAAVRIAMTVGTRPEDPSPVRRFAVTAEGPEAGDDARAVTLDGGVVGAVFADLRAGADVTAAQPLNANRGLSCRGVSLHGAGFIVTRAEAEAWGYDPADPRPTALARVVKPYRNGRDLTATSRDAFVIDFYGLSQAEAMAFPGPFQRVLERVKPERDVNNGEEYRRNWWLFGKTRPAFRPALAGLPRYIATVETAKHRVFQFLDGAILPDNMLIAIASEDALHLGVLSSRLHVVWALAAGGRLGVGNDPRYNKSRCFDPFPFPAPTEPQADSIRTLAEQLDAHRKTVLAEHPTLTLTGLYNVLAALRAGEPLDSKAQRINELGRVSTLKLLHDQLDAAVAAAYGWPADLDDEAILLRLVALNAERRAEEAAGHVRWLRPAFQHPVAPVQPGLPTPEAAPTEADAVADAAPAATAKIPWPSSAGLQLKLVRDLLLASGGLWSADAVARSFKHAHRATVQRHMDTWADLGLVQPVETLEGRAWLVVGGQA
jgi:hypothetical protein